MKDLLIVDLPTSKKRRLVMVFETKGPKYFYVGGRIEDVNKYLDNKYKS